MGPHPPKGTDEASPRTAAEDARGPFDELLQRVARTPDVTPDFLLSRDAAVGPFIGRFELIRPLGRGGFGVVYRARDTELGRHVAVKLLRLDRRGASDRAWLLDVFHREAEAAAKLNHPNIITIFDYGIHGGAPFSSSSSWWARRSPLAWDGARSPATRRWRSWGRSAAVSRTPTPPG